MNNEFAFAELANKKILITGGTGYFGKNLCGFLNQLNEAHALNITIYVMARKPITQKGIFFVEQDVAQKINFDIPVDFIIHAATPVFNDLSTPEELLNIIINGTQNIARMAAKLNCKRFLHVSSGAVYSAQPEWMEKIEEDYFEEVAIFDFKNPYGTGKRISELMLGSIFKNSDTSYSVARCFAFSGKYLAFDQQLAIGNFIRDAIESKSINIKGDGSAIRSYLDSEDLNIWLLTMLLKGRNQQAYNLGSEEAISIKELAFKVAGFLNGTTVTIQNLNSENIKKNRYVPSTKKVFEEMGLRVSVTLDESIKRMISFYKGTK